MFGSDWPVCLAACSYARWLATVAELCAALSPAERDSGEFARAIRMLAKRRLHPELQVTDTVPLRDVAAA